MNLKKILKPLGGKSIFSGRVTVNDLRDKNSSRKGLTDDEQEALRNFDNYRHRILGEQTTEESFHQKYLEFQALANLAPYEEFLKDKYRT